MPRSWAVGGQLAGLQQRLVDVKSAVRPSSHSRDPVQCPRLDQHEVEHSCITDDKTRILGEHALFVFCVGASWQWCMLFSMEGLEAPG